MNFINPELKFIKYRKRKLKIVYKNLDDLYGLYDPNKQIIYFDQNMKGERLFNTIFHVICYNDGIDVNKRGEEPIAQAVGDGYTRIFKQNPKLWDILQDCLFG